MGQKYSTIVQIIVKADRGKAIASYSVSCKMTCYHNQTKKLFRFSVCILSPLCSLQSTFEPSLHFYPVCSLMSAFCTNRYPWHQYNLFLVTVIRTTHTIYHHKIPVSVNSTFSFFSALILSFPLVRM